MQSLGDGRYVPTRMLGIGGGGAVYEAWDRNLEVRRAVKLLDPKLARHQGAWKRFQAEAVVMARLSHPHIVSVVDLRLDADPPFLVMELLPAGTVADWLHRHGAMPPRRAAAVARQVLQALGAAHARGVVHRDVKPGNVLIADADRVKLADFGIARAHEVNDHRTLAGQAFGTPAYMPPEQLRDAGAVDARADLYAVGVSLWQLLTGLAPDHFAAGRLDGPLADVVAAATAASPDDRYPDADAMIAALDAAVAALPADPPAPPLVDPDLDLDHTPPPSLSSGATTARVPDPSGETLLPTHFDVVTPPPPPGTLAAVDAPDFLLDLGEPASAPAPAPPDDDDEAAPTSPRLVVAALVAVSAVAVLGFLALRPGPAPIVPADAPAVVAPAVVEAPPPAPQPPPVAAPRPRPTAPVRIETRPTATIVIDGEVVGSGTWEGPLRVGAHRLELMAADHATVRQALTVFGADQPVDWCWDVAKNEPCG